LSEVLLSYAVVGAVTVVLWVLSDPVAGLLVLASLAGLVVGLRRAAVLVRCLRTCGGFTVEVPGGIQVCISRGETTCATA
jgi:hypothetical protein